jgi:hypothetical protein
MGKLEMCTNYRLGRLMGRDHSEDLYIEDNIKMDLTDEV